MAVFYSAPDDIQAQTRTLAYSLSCKERLENARLNFRWNARTKVCNLNLNIIATAKRILVLRAAQ